MLAFSCDQGLSQPSSCLFLGAEPHAMMETWPQVTGWHPLKPSMDAWKSRGFSGSHELPEGKWPVVLILPGKSKDETLAWFALGRERLESGGTMVVAMPNTAGAGRFEKELAKATGEITSIQKNKCRAFYAKEDGGWHEAVFSEWLRLAEPTQIVGTGFTTIPGVFSSAHVDAGSRLLVDHVPANVRGRVADLGAGWGYLSAEVLKKCPNIIHLDLYEADARALSCARWNLAGLGEPQSRLASPPCSASEEKIGFIWHDVTSGLPEEYDTIIMNPPFHSGQSTDVDLGRAFIHAAAKSLKRGGKLWMVANRQLPYEATLEAAGFSWRIIASDSVFKIFSADRR